MIRDGAPRVGPATMEAAIHTREVRPPSARGEGAMAARLAFHVAYWAMLLASAETYAAGGAAKSAPSPFEVRFQQLSNANQRIYREVQEGVLEAERVRSSTGRWPGADELASDGVAPFAPDPIDRARHTWITVRGGTAVNYVGTEAGGREALWMLAVEPDPGTPKDPTAPVDEVHHRLADGTMIHVTVWLGPPPAPGAAAVATLPPDLGYKQIVMGR